MLLMPAAYHGVMPFFGILFSGVLGTLICLLLATLWLYLAWGTYRLNPASWWIAMVAMILAGASGIVTFARGNLIEMYRAMGYPETQIRQMDKFQFFQGAGMIWAMGIGLVAMLAYLGYVKRFFGRGPSEL